jgi:DNA-binding LytR/AlgR family response regulator
MKYIIIEDEQLASKRLRELMTLIRPDYVFMAKFDSVESATISLPVLRYDLILMDIQLADGNSFDIFDQIKVNAPIIFTTAYDEYAIKAFKTNSIDYLLKPIDENELTTAIEKFERNRVEEVPKSSESNESIEITDLIKTLQPKGKERFVVKVGEHLKTIETVNVQMVYSQNKATYLLSNEGKKFLIDYSLDKVEELLNETQFFRISRKFIININFIKDIISFTNSRLEIMVDHFDDEKIVVARERVNDFKAWLDR